MQEVKDRDFALWSTWKKTNSPQDLQDLLNQMTPIINREVSKWASGTSRSYLESEGKRLAVEAFRSFDPKQGTTLSTYLAGRLPKLSRSVYSTIQAARMPEALALLHSTYHKATQELLDANGREPNSEELCDHLGWAPKKLAQYQRSLRSELIESEGHSDEANADDHLIDFAYSELNPQQKLIFEYASGYLGRPKLDNTAIIKKLNITQAQLSYEKRKIGDIIERVYKGQ